jgi:hypothetical protein
MISNVAFLLHVGFFNRISDNDVGGTYLTFLASCHNLGNQLTVSMSLFLIE